MPKGRIGVMTGGGDTTALNATLKGIALETESAGLETVGVQWGWAGMLSGGEAAMLPADAIDENRGGTVIRSSRTNLRKVENGIEQAVQRIQQLRLDGFVAIGGDDTLTVAAAVAAALRQEAKSAPINCVTKTIDNDVGTNPPADQPLQLETMKNYYCPGFITAANWLAQQTAALRTTAYSHGRIAALETMGRTAGWLALATAYGRPDAIILPEAAADPDQLADITRKAYEKNRHAVVVIAEGARFEDADDAGHDDDDGEVDMFGHKKLEGSSAWAVKHLQQELGVTVNHVIPAYLQRSGSPHPLDRDAAIKLGRKAARAVLDGQTNMVACSVRSGNRIETDIFRLDQVLKRDESGTVIPRIVDPRLYNPETMNISADGWEYFLPLLGEPTRPYQNPTLQQVS